jgi:hypothetical protein
MKLAFTVGSITIDTPSDLAQRLALALKKVRYEGNMAAANSSQINLDFDERLCCVLEEDGWECERKPRIRLDHRVDSGKQEADAILRWGTAKKKQAVLEIEKSNKKTLWLDFVKLWMFIGSRQASQGIILCPRNYAHKVATWDLYNEALCIKRYFAEYAAVPKEKLSLITLVGYEQMITVDGIARRWTSYECIRLKREFRSLSPPPASPIYRIS